MSTESEHISNGETNNVKGKKSMSMPNENEKDIFVRKELPYPFEKELIQKQVKIAPAIIKEFIPIKDTDSCNVMVSKFCGYFLLFNKI